MRRVQWPRRCVECRRSRDDVISPVGDGVCSENRDLDMRAVCVKVVVGRCLMHSRPCVELLYGYQCRSGDGYGVERVPKVPVGPVTY